MKCNACGYIEPKPTTEQIEEDYEDFVNWNDLFYQTKLFVRINEKRGSWDYDRISEREVYVCPKCGTLKIEV